MCKFSIIIPAYNLEKHIKRCVASVTKQSFKDFEVIIINDGSQDKTLEIIEKLALEDKRIKVIDKKNEGAASARNQGLKNVEGEYTTFVDGDDIIEERYLENISNIIEQTKTDIVLMNIQRSEKEEFEKLQQKEEYFTIKKLEAMNKVLYQKELDSSVAGKVYRKWIWENEKFPEGCLYEDLAVIIDLLDKTDKIIYYQYCGYQYILRSEGTTWKKFDENKMQLVTVCKEIEKKFVKKYPSLQSACNYRILESSFHLFFQAYRIDNKNASKLWKNIKMGRNQVFNDKNVKLKTKLAIILSFFGKQITYYTFKFISNKKFYKRGKC